MGSSHHGTSLLAHERQRLWGVGMLGIEQGTWVDARLRAEIVSIASRLMLMRGIV